jgi:Stress responsive A/B Barrel Domain
MVRHIVMFRFTEQATEEQIARVISHLRTLKRDIPEVQSLLYGRDLALSPDTFGLVVQVDFSSGEDYVSYRDHPAHRQFQTETLAPVLMARTAVQVVLQEA